MFYLIGQIGLILAVAAVLFFALGYWYGRHKSTEKQQPLVFEKGSVTAAAVAVLEEYVVMSSGHVALGQLAEQLGPGGAPPNASACCCHTVANRIRAGARTIAR